MQTADEMKAYHEKMRRLERSIIDLDASAISEALAAVTGQELRQMIEDAPGGPIALVLGISEALKSGGAKSGEDYMRSRTDVFEPPVDQ